MKIFIFSILFFICFSSYSKPTYKIVNHNRMDTTKSKKIDTCDYKQNFIDNLLFEEGCLKFRQKHGLWKEYNKKSGELRFLWTYYYGIKHGPYLAYYENGTVEAKGKYKNGTIDDTLKLYNRDGKLIEIEIWKANPDGKFSNIVESISYDKTRKSDGTMEFKDGKKYIWMDGKLEPFDKK